MHVVQATMKVQIVIRIGEGITSVITCLSDITGFDWLKAEGNITFIWPLCVVFSDITFPENTPANSLISWCRVCDVTWTIVFVT